MLRAKAAGSNAGAEMVKEPTNAATKQQQEMNTRSLRPPDIYGRIDHVPACCRSLKETSSMPTAGSMQ